MRVRPATLLLIVAVFSWVLPAYGQAPRQDAIWARVAQNPITLDGVLDEADWALAETKVVRWAEDAGIPGSGWKNETPLTEPSDPTTATLKFLVYENQLYLGAVVEDVSIGGSAAFERFDGFLMALKDHGDPNAPKPPNEYFYSWWYPLDPDPQPPGQPPAFKGRWAEEPPGSPRTPEQIEAWDAVTVVDGLSNDDSVLDTSYTVEMRFNLTPMGYDVTTPQGDIIEWNISIYDCDWFWPNVPMLSSNRVWWQGPWGNAMWYGEVRIHARPDVTTAGPLPEPIPPELIIHEIDDPAPTIDGELSEGIWNHPDVYSFDIRYGDDVLRQTYPGVGRYRAGQYQAEVNGGQAAVVDPADATVKIFFQDDFLYLGFDARDQFVQYIPIFDRWDGFLVTLNERETRGPDNQLLGRRLSFQVAQDGSALPHDYLNTLITVGGAEVAIALKPGTEPDTLGVPDTGYTAELMIDLTRLGYPPGLGDRILFIGVNHLDGDSFDPFTFSYGTRTWWFREYEGECCPVWAHLAPAVIGVDDQGTPPPTSGYSLVRSYPNPSQAPIIQYLLPESNRATLEVFDLNGRLIERQILGIQPAGLRAVIFDGSGKRDGVFPYRLLLEDPSSGTLRATLYGKLVLLR